MKECKMSNEEFHTRIVELRMQLYPANGTLSKEEFDLLCKERVLLAKRASGEAQMAMLQGLERIFALVGTRFMQKPSA
jgi:hypothetical protein